MTGCAVTKPNLSLRRGACPSLASPMQTGDGLLVRLRPAGSLAPTDLRKIATLAGRFGNGLIEVTARGNLQIRGLTASAVASLASAITEAGIGISDGVALEMPPLAGFDPEEIADPRPLGAQLRAAIARHQPALTLAPKLSIVVDGGGRFHLKDVAADLRLDALDGEGGVRWLLSVGSQIRSARPVALLASEQIVPAVMEVLAELNFLGPGARGRDLDTDRIRQRRPDAALPAVPDGRSPWLPAGIHDFGDGRIVLGLGLAYAQAEANTLIALMDGVEEMGATEIRLSPRHGLLVLGLSSEAAILAQDLALTQGLLVSPDDPRNHIAACAGRACASALMDTKAAARLLAEAGGDLLDGSLAVHLSGCAKGCARPTASPLTLVGAPSGYALVVNGTASVVPSAYTNGNGIGSALARLNGLVRENKGAGESARSCLTRLGSGSIAAAFEQG
ncbi:precorrin-3B synthase [Ensifer sp. LCM 4579]|uniref:precorrin-3B synthase n=1 Tax=Ensifer sp. LCM 4579 TaxID=1848292 RepID=UPI0008D9BA4A|nr:precorrin-3B synthase [Ensifer sp. LCM 4579]OHV75549.1 precorrin-3B synthase [Ensifer sp. LCM 4579]